MGYAETTASPRSSFVMSPDALRMTQCRARNCTDDCARNGPAVDGQLARCCSSGSSAKRTLHRNVSHVILINM